MIEKLPLGAYLKPFLEKIHFYQALKYSESGLWLWRKLAPTYDVLIRREEAFYRALLSRLDASRPVLFDIGAHEGWIAKVFMEYSERVVAVEPDPFARWIMRNRFGKKNADGLVIVGKAVSNDQGRATMFVQQRGSALNTLDPKWKTELERGFLGRAVAFEKKIQVETTTLDALIDEFGCPALVKIDVEGHELAVFQGLGRPLPQVVFEANLPVFLHETLEILRLLQALDPKVHFNYAHSFQLQLESFVPAEVLAEKVLHLPKGTYDIVVRMSSYGEIYRS